MKLLKLVPDNTNFRFLRWRHIAMGISIFSIIASLVLVGVRGLNLGVDFVGGQMIQVTFDKVAEAPVAELREDIEALNLGVAGYLVKPSRVTEIAATAARVRRG